MDRWLDNIRIVALGDLKGQKVNKYSNNVAVTVPSFRFYLIQQLYFRCPEPSPRYQGGGRFPARLTPLLLLCSGLGPRLKIQKVT